MKHILYLAVVLLCFSACNNDDYLLDGGKADPEVHMTTYDFLKSKSLFDTLVLAIDKAGLKDVVNSKITFYAPTNFSFKKYVDKELEYRRGFDPEAQFSFDSIPTEIFRDSLQMYMFERVLTRDSLDKAGKICTSRIGRQFKLSNEPEEVFTDILVEPVGFLYFINKRGNRFDSYDERNSVADKEKDTRERIQTSGIITTTGIVHVINNAHILFFHRVD